MTAGSEKEARFTSQPQLRIENTPKLIEVDQRFLALDNMANNSNSAFFNKNTSRIFRLEKLLTTTLPTFDGIFLTSGQKRTKAFPLHHEG